MNHLPETSPIVDLRHADPTITPGQTPDPSLIQARGQSDRTEAAAAAQTRGLPLRYTVIRIAAEDTFPS
jgi:hypothetical protein